MAERQRPSLPATPLALRRAVVIGAGSFGTAVAVLLARGGVRTTLQTRTAEQAAELEASRENSRYLPGVELPPQLKIEAAGSSLRRADYVLLAVPSAHLDLAIAGLETAGLNRRAAIISLSKGLVPPEGVPPTVVLSQIFGERRVGCVGGPAHAQEMVADGAALVCASSDETLATSLSSFFQRAGVVCEPSSDPIGVEIAGAAKNAAALAAGATQSEGLNAAGAAAGHIVLEAWRYAEGLGGKPETFIGLAGIGDLVATTLAPQSRNRRAGELLGQGVPGDEIPERVGQAVESLEAVPLLAAAYARAGVDAPITNGLAALISGALPMDEWVALVRTTTPTTTGWRARRRPGFTQRWRERWRERRETSAAR